MKVLHNRSQKVLGILLHDNTPALQFLVVPNYLAKNSATTHLTSHCRFLPVPATEHIVDLHMLRLSNRMPQNN